ETRSIGVTRSRGERGVGAGPGCVRRESAPSSPGSAVVVNVVAAGGVRAHPAAEGAGRGRHHAADPDPPGANHHTTGSEKTPRRAAFVVSPHLRRPDQRWY